MTDLIARLAAWLVCLIDRPSGKHREQRGGRQQRAVHQTADPVAPPSAPKPPSTFGPDALPLLPKHLYEPPDPANERGAFPLSTSPSTSAAAAPCAA